MRILSALLAGTLLAASTASVAAKPSGAPRPSVAERGEAKLAKELAGRVPGKPVDCLYLRDIQSSEVIDGTAIVYRTGANRIYVNRPKSGQESLDSDAILVTDTHSSQLCSIDTVRLIDRYSRFYRGFVGLGEFVPYTKAPAAPDAPAAQ